MQIVIDNLYTFWLLIFIFFTLNIIRNIYFFINSFIEIKNYDEKEEIYNEVYHPEQVKAKFSLPKKNELLFLGISISYFLTYIIWLIKK